MKKLRLLLVLSILLFFISSCGNGDSSDYSKLTITIIGTSDIQGTMNSFDTKIDLNNDGIEEEHNVGGIARIASIIDDTIQENPNTIVVSTGDDLMGTFFHYYNGKAIFSLMSKSGYQFYAFGNHEFDKGSDILSQALDNASFTVLCSDLDVSNSSLDGKCVKYYIKKIDNINIGLFSLMTEDFPYITIEDKVKLIDTNINIARKMVKLLKDKGADIIIALTHIGKDMDEKIAKEVNGIDIIFGGHSHGYIFYKDIINNTLIVNGGEKGIYVVKINLKFFDNKTLNLLKSNIQLIPVDENIKDNVYIKDLLDLYNNQLPPAVVLGTTDKEWDLRESEIRYNESNVCDMINDLLKNQFKVDIVLNNSGAFRGDKVYPAGDITDAMLREIDEFGNYAFTFKLQGKYVKEVLEHSAASYGHGGFLQVSGIKFKIDLDEIPQEIDFENEKIVQKGNRVSDIQVLIDGKWENLDDNKIYTILSNAYLVNYAGDGYYWFRKYGTDFKNTYTTFYSIMESYLEKYHKLTPPDKDGRILIIGGGN